MNTPVDILMHGGDINYIDLNEGELCHWKYIKREKLPNGKYRYSYDESELKEAAKNVEKAQKDSVNKAFDVYNAKQDFAKARTEVGKANIHNYARPSADSYKEYATASVNYGIKEYNLKKAQTAHKEAVSKANAAERKYQTKKITSFAARTISKGIVKIANLLSGSSSKKKKR